MSSPRSSTSIAVGLVLIVTDLATKAIATKVPEWPLVEPRVNDELALGLLSDESPTPLLIVALVCVVFVLGDLVRRSHSSSLAMWSLVLVLAGGLANAIDRVVTGGVHDFLHLGPVVANLADFWLLGGLIGYVVVAVRPEQPPDA